VTAGVHQVLAGATPQDAITNHALLARDVMRRMGLRSEVFVDAAHLSGDLPRDVLPHYLWDRATGPRDRAVLHYSIDSPAFGYVLARAPVAAVHYHNITPAELLWKDAPHIAWDCLRGREELARLAPRVAMAATESEYNATELRAMDFPDPVVVGILRRQGRADAGATAPRARAGPPRILFVGRGAPNKCQHDLVLATAALADAGVDAELRLVGSWGENAAYRERCLRLARECGVAERVHLCGSVSDEELAYEFAAADVFVSMSEHEGFGVPLLEAMEAGLPIVAYSAGAVAETLGNAGLLLDDKAPSMVAESIAAVLAGNLAAQMARGRAEQLDRHVPAAVEQRLTAFIEDLLTC